MMQRNHAHIFLNKRVRMYQGALVLLSLTLAAPVAAQDPTPTPIVTGDYVIHQAVTYGDGGIIVGLLFVGGLVLLNIWLELSHRMTER